MSGANLRFGVAGPENANRTVGTTRFECHPGGTTEAAIILTLGALGMSANIILMTLLLAKKHLRRWSQGLLFHQALVDCSRAAILIPLGRSIYSCVPVTKCSLVETAFLLLVTVSTINMLTTVLNDAPLLPEDSDQKQMPLLMESPQCVLFGTFMIWFASITINLGPTFLSGALAANIDDIHNAPSCPLIMGPLRHYVLNVLWIVTNVLVLLLTIFHLHKLYRDLSTSSIEAVRIASLVTTMISVSQPQNQDPEERESRQLNSHIRRMEREGVERVKMFIVVTIAYVVFWGPLFLVTLMTPSVENPGLSHEVTLHVAYVHAFVNPALFLALHKGLRRAVTDILCCNCSSDDATTLAVSGNSGQLTSMRSTISTSHSNIGVGGMPLSDSLVGSAGLCSTGTMVTLGTGTMGTIGGSGTMGTLGPGSMGTLGPGSMGTLGPGSMGTLGPGSLGTLGPGSMGTLGSGTMGTLGPGSMGTLGPGLIGGATALPPNSSVGGVGGGLITYVPDGDVTPPFATLTRSYLYNDVSSNPTNLHAAAVASHEEFSSLHRTLHGQSSTKGRLA